jgi:hypothetical protein
MFPRTLLHSAVVCTLIASSALVSGCSDDSTPATTTGPDRTIYAPVRIEAEMTTASVTPSAKKDPNAHITSGAVVDSIRITDLKMLMAKFYMFRDRFASASGSNTVKRGTALCAPPVEGGTAWVCNGNLPTGTYNLLRFELENSADSATISTLPDIASFLSTGANSTIIEGVAYSNGVATPFEYKSDALPDLSLDVTPTIVISAGVSHTMILTIDPGTLFKSNGTVLDPSDPANRTLIDAAIPNSFRGLRAKQL